MSGARMLLAAVAPLRLTFWVLVAGTTVIVVLVALVVARHFQGVRGDRRREHVRAELEPVFSRFLESEDHVRLAGELRPAFLRMDAAHRPVAALLTIDLVHEVPYSQRDQLRVALEEAGIVELGERGTRRLSPWRRALACEALGQIGAERSVPALLDRLDDRRPEVRIEAVRALGEIGSKEAVPPLSKAFLERGVAPTNIVNSALRRIGGEAAPAFERGITSEDPIVRLSSCFGFSGIAAQHGVAVVRLAEVLASDSDARVRAAARGSAWSLMNGLLIISGAFGVFRRDVLIALGGFSRATMGEDMEMTMRIHHLLRPQMKDARVEFVPDAVCWTEAPGTLGGLRNQRVRWHTGLLDNFRMHWRMFGRPRFGAAGIFAMPYLFLFEVVEPVVEVLGFAIVITLLIENVVNWTYLLAFVFIAALTGAVMSAASLLIEEIGFHRYRSKDLVRLTAWGLVEAFWYRPPLAWWRLKATLLALIGRRPGWGVIPHGEAILEHPPPVVAPLTR